LPETMAAACDLGEYLLVISVIEIRQSEKVVCGKRTATVWVKIEKF
jgi:hypothetical protein